ncbi:hypothetical protein HCN44_010108 [Aphidius gifuensis]|uniref:Uncharacterized protein n=1 Tax=Aphidius gifuensis TaxID=684658 RepID=A0A835CTP6_APHGI|nr:uncharacterized protein LOC122851703 [Aphidius gifuensis]KAF7993513.1 hypothetical protein HCN44_010108 [Aphidius gifuensis]
MEHDINSSNAKNDNSIFEYSVDYSGASSIQDILNLSVDMRHRRRGFIVSPDVIDEFNKTNNSFLNVSMLNPSHKRDDDDDGYCNIKNSNSMPAKLTNSPARSIKKTTGVDDLSNEDKVKKKLENLNNTPSIDIDDRANACIEEYKKRREYREKRRLINKSSTTPNRYNCNVKENKVISGSKSMKNHESTLSKRKEIIDISKAEEKTSKKKQIKLKSLVNLNESSIASDELSCYDFDPTSVIDGSSTCLLEKSYRDICAKRHEERQKRNKMMIDSQEIRKRKRYSESSESSDSSHSQFKKTRKSYVVEDSKVDSSLRLMNRRRNFKLRSRAIVVDSSSDSDDKSSCKKQFALESTKSSKKKVKKRW